MLEKEVKVIAIKKDCAICGQSYVDQSISRNKCTCSPRCYRKYYNNSNPEKYFEKRLYLRINVFRRQGVIFTSDELLIIKEKLNLGMCEICGNIFPMDELHIDHDHATNKYRGILCHNCNHVLGMVYDNPLILEEMITYLRRFK